MVKLKDSPPNNAYKRQSSLSLIKHTSKILFPMKNRTSSTSSTSSKSSIVSFRDSFMPSFKETHTDESSPKTLKLASSSREYNYQAKMSPLYRYGSNSNAYSSVHSTPFSHSTRSTDSPTSSNFSFNSYDSRHSVVSSSNSHPSSEKKRILINESCCFCEELLTNTLSGESIVTLSCSHHSHYDCLSMLMTMNYSMKEENEESYDSNEMNVICPLCDAQVTCEDEDTRDQLIKFQLLSSKSIDLDLFDVMTPKANTSLITPNVTSALNGNQIVTPVCQTGENFNDYMNQGIPKNQLRLDYQSPQISPLTREPPSNLSLFRTDSLESTTLFAPGKRQLDNQLSVSSPGSFPTSSLFANEARISIVPQYSKIVLANVQDEASRFHEVLCLVDASIKDTRRLSSFNNSSSVSSSAVDQHHLTNRSVEENNLRFETAELERLYESVKTELNADHPRFDDIIHSCYIDVDMNGESHKNVACILFEKRLIIASLTGRILQDIDLINQVSSMVQHESKGTTVIVFHLTLLDLPEFSMTTKQKQLSNYLSSINRRKSKLGGGTMTSTMRSIPSFDTSSATTPLFKSKTYGASASLALPLSNRVVTSSISLVEKGLQYSPNRSIENVSQLVESNNVDMNYSSDAIPSVHIILVISLRFNEDLGISPKGYTNGLKTYLETVLANLSLEDKIGVVFIDKPYGSNIGNYYGCVDVDWEGWLDVIQLIECNTEPYAEDDSVQRQLDEGMKYAHILVSLSGGGTTSEDSNSFITQIMFLNSNVYSAAVAAYDGDEEATEPLVLGRRTKKRSFFETVERLCDEKNCGISFIILTDEFKYQPIELIQHFKEMTKFSSPGKISNYVDQYLILDFNSLQDKLIHMMDNLHKVTVKRVSSKLVFKDTVKVIGIEHNGEMIDLHEENRQLSTLNITLNNVHPGNQKSVLLKLRVDLEAVSPKIIEASSEYESVKLEYVTQFTKIEPIGKPTTIREFDQVSMLRFGSSTTEDNPAANINLSVEEQKGGDSEFHQTVPDTTFEIILVKCQSVMQDAMLIKRQVILAYLKILNEQVFNAKNFNLSTRESIKVTMSKFLKETQSKLHECNTSNTKRLGKSDIQNWFNAFQVKADDIIEGYSMRNYQLSNLKCCIEYFSSI